MIVEATGNLLTAPTEAQVNTVNTAGVMGAGVALQFRQAYPEMFRAYAKACKAGEVQPGRMHVFERATFENPKFIINFPTKRHWRGKSRIEDIEAGLRELVAVVHRLRIKSLALPPLGCGNGGLNWALVRPMIERAFAGLPEVQVHLYSPGSAPKVDEIRVNTDRPTLTRGRSLMILLLARYFIPGYRVSLLEIQKLAYFLQEAGEDLRLNYARGQYGPYAESLHHVLQRMEGHYTRGYGDRTVKAKAEITLLPGAAEAAMTMAAATPEANERLHAVNELISGFESPYGMELLSTVHWVSKEHSAAAESPEAATELVRAWSARKAALFAERDIRAAWSRLRDLGWMSVHVNR